MSDFSTVADPEISKSLVDRMNQRYQNRLQCNWYGIVAYVNGTGKATKEANYFAFKHLHVISTHTTYAEMEAYAKDVFAARNAVKMTAKQHDAEMKRVVAAAGGMDALKRKIGTGPKPPAATVVIATAKGFLEMDSFVAANAHGSHLLVPVYNGAIIKAEGNGTVRSETAAEIEVSTRKDKDGRWNVFHFKGIGAKAWDPDDENVQLIPFWMFG